MSPAAWGGLALAWFAALAMPGPDVFLILRLGVRERRAAVRAGIGIMVGNLIWLTASVLGMGVLLATLPMLLPVVQLAGSAVLCWLGVQSARGGIAQLRQARSGSEAVAPAQVRRPLVLGIVTNLSNPKAVIFYTALLSQFLPPEPTWGAQAVIISVLTLSGLAWFVGVAIASSAAAFRAWFGRAASWLDLVAGMLFIAIAVVIAFGAIMRLTSGA